MSAQIDNDLHRLRGTRVTRAAPSNNFPAGRPKMPKDLSEVAQEKWREMIRVLAQRGTLTKGDGPALEIFCEAFARWRSLLNELQEHGVMVDVTVLDSSGTAHTKRVQNPAAKLAAQLDNSLRAMLKEFSATPASRERAKRAAPQQPKAVAQPGTVAYELQQQQEEQQETEQEREPVDFGDVDDVEI